MACPSSGSIAIFCACLALSFGCEIVVFSPARRASRKLLERMVEVRRLGPRHVSTTPTPTPVCGRPQFIRLLDCDSNIVEYNQEQCRVTSYNGKSSLIRSFPSKVGVSTAKVLTLHKL